MNVGLVGAIAGSAVGIVGGLIGTYFSYRRAKNVNERRFVIFGSTGIFVYVGSFLAVLFILPQTHPTIFIPYAIILVVGITYLNRRLNKIQRNVQTQ
jgi:uncharacterized membrane protein YfcA